MPLFKVYWVGTQFADTALEAAQQVLQAIENEEDSKVFLLENQETGECSSVDLAEFPPDAVMPLTKRDFRNIITHI